MIAKDFYKVEEYNRNIPLLLSQDVHGSVHSKFNNGFNIQIGTNLIFIGSDKGGQLPFSLILPLDAVHELLKKIDMNAPVLWNHKEGILTIDERCDILFLEGRPYDNKLDKLPGSEATLVSHLEIILMTLAANDEPTGMNLDINDFMEHYVTYQEKTGNNYDPYYDLMDVLYSEDEVEVERVLRYFLGRGKGGTPTGDDHIVGLMALYAVATPWNELFPNVLSRLIKNEKITTDVSIEYLKYALKNQFGSPVLELIAAMVNDDAEIVQEKTNNLLSMGHSSGLDTMFGIMLGLLTMRRKING
ncbi:oxamate carbamoyltransferase subunit AllH family protein [Oceanobacillus sp. CAU 1775]